MTSRADTVSYRRDIDGLRALAVAAVILYHLDEKLLPGGFTGVDIFFVISGYVVTGSMLRSATSSPLADVLYFWRRRLLRIIPALVAFVFGATLLSALFLTPYPAVQYSGALRTGLAALFGVGNLYLHRLGQNYFASDQTLNLFSHTWSLGVEEQFYIVFSLLVIGVPGLLFSSRGQKHRATVVTILLLSVVSFVLFLRGAGRDPVGTYYFLHTRLWELGVGALLAMAAAGTALAWIRGSVSSVVQIVGVAGLAWAMIVPADAWTFPSMQIIVAVLATGALMIAGDRSTTPVTRMLASRAAVFVGLISYSLYLWHWPVISLFRFTTGLHNPVFVVLALLITGVLAYGSYRYVERPWRWSEQRFLTQLLPRLVGAAGIVIAVAVVSQIFPGFLRLGTPQRWTEEWLPNARTGYAASDRLTQEKCFLHIGDAVPTRIPGECSSAPDHDGELEPDGRRVLAIGDSFAFANWGMVNAGAAKSGYEVTAYAHSDCSASQPVGSRPPSCKAYWELATRTIRESLRNSDVVFVSFRWFQDARGGYSPVRLQLAELADAAEEVGAAVVVQAPLPMFERPGFTCIPDWYRLDFTGCVISRSEAQRQRDRALGVLAESAISDGVGTWDPLEFVCQNDCRMFNNGKPVFRDKIHLSHHASKSLGDMFATTVFAQ